ncbi:uncharacterized protein LOC125020184 [Mugil cephalus]|uniref:uncharacterized protein LOC125020184 n=1 Tax=Mugil cephalus TaxID=48193 RepID=UPI001FB6F76D|nr:uncharacterized protein LOC125020184 [Mugil cephalus]
MLWHTEMACGVCLGILLVLVKAEHVCCSSATEAQQHGNTYVGFVQQGGRLRTFGVGHPQNGFRQASVQRSSLNTETPVNGGYHHGHSTSSYTQTMSQPAQSLVRIVQSNLLSQPNWQLTDLEWVKSQKPGPDVSTVVSGGSLSKGIQKQSDLTVLDQESTVRVQKGTPRTSKYLSSSVSIQSPSREGYFILSSIQQPVSQKPVPAYSGQGGWSSMKSSTLFDADAPASQSHSATSARAPGRRASPRTSKPISRKKPKQAGSVYKSRLFPVTEEYTQHEYQPSPTSNAVSSPAYNQNGFKPRSLVVPSKRVQSYKSSYAPVEQNPSGTREKYAPTRTYNIPEHLGGFAIRRLKEPINQREAGVQTPDQSSTSWQQMGSYEPQGQTSSGKLASADNVYG